MNIPTGIPLVYEFDDNFNVLEKYYLGNEEEIEKKIKSVEKQGENITNKEIEII